MDLLITINHKTSVRITEQQREFLIEKISMHRPDAKIYLFGSRVDDKARGGDIDVLILDKRKLEVSELADIESSFWQTFGEQKIDLVCFKPESEHPFKTLALRQSIPLQ